MRTAVALILIHSWYSQQCCGGQDCHPVPCDEISRAANGDYVWQNPYQEAIIFGRHVMKLSEDEQCHVCVNPDNDFGICIYLAPRT